MLTNKDIKKLESVFATKEDILELRDELKKDFSEQLQENNKKLIKYSSTVFVTKKEFEDFNKENRKNFSDLHTAIDTYAKKADTYFQEMVMLSRKVERQERWIKQIADKVGVKLEV